MGLVIDDEFKGLIPSLTAEEYEQLEKSILAEGVREKIIVWNNIIVDGHSRYEIALKYGIPFGAIEKHFEDREQVKEYIILNQFGRRNLTPYQRSVLALKLKPVYEERAKERMLSGTLLPTSQKSEQGRTSDNLAKLAGVSRDTIYKVEYVNNKAPLDIIEQLKKGAISINKAFTVTKKGEEKMGIGLSEVAISLTPELEQQEKEQSLYIAFRSDVIEKFNEGIIGVLNINADPKHLDMLLENLDDVNTVEKKLKYINSAISHLETIKEYLNNNKPN